MIIAILIHPLEVLYWMYVEKHPAHCAPILLSEKTVAEAHNALTWEGEKLLPSGNRIDVPIFSQEERQQFSDSLRMFNGTPPNRNHALHSLVNLRLARQLIVCRDDNFDTGNRSYHASYV